MSSTATKAKSQFTDYCLVLQVHPEADAVMIDAAYWHLAKRYNQAGPRDPQARKKLEELNEAYTILGSPDRREEYLKTRAAVLGEGALPTPPPPVAEKPPLSIMERQPLRPREPPAEVEQSVRKLWRPNTISSALAIPFVLALAIAAFLAGASPDTVAGLLIVGLLFTALPLVLPVLRLRPVSPRIAAAARPMRLPTIHLPRRGGRDRSPAPVPFDPGQIQSSTKARAEQLRNRGQSSGDSSSPIGPAD